MTLETSNPVTAQFRLIDLGASGTVVGGYDTGGTDYGHALSHGAVGNMRDMENLTKQIFGTHWTDGTFNGENMVLEIVLGQRSSQVLKLGWNPHWLASNSGLLNAAPQIPLGHAVKNAGRCTRLLIRPVKPGNNPKALVIDKTRPALLLPYAYCIKVGATQYNERGKLFEAAVLTIVSYWDETNGLNRYWGDPDTFPDIEPEEEPPPA